MILKNKNLLHPFFFSREEERLEFVNVGNKFENSEADDAGDTWQMVIQLYSPTKFSFWKQR